LAEVFVAVDPLADFLQPLGGDPLIALLEPLAPRDLPLRAADDILSPLPSRERGRG